MRYAKVMAPTLRAAAEVVSGVAVPLAHANTRSNW